MSILAYFDKAYVVNLPSRTDRRREIEAMFDRLGLSDWRERVKFHPAHRPESPGGFRTIGARGCFISQLEVLRQARDAGAGNVLLMEDDLEIAPDFVRRGDELTRELDRGDWSIAHLGHVLELPVEDPNRLFQHYVDPIQTAHFVVFRGEALPGLIEFLESVLQRPAGHPEGGPMDVDGAYSFYRWVHPGVRAIVATPSLGFQRSSASDITTRWFDQIPGLRAAAAAGRWVKRRGRV